MYGLIPIVLSLLWTAGSNRVTVQLDPGIDARWQTVLTITADYVDLRDIQGVPMRVGLLTPTCPFRRDDQILAIGPALNAGTPLILWKPKAAHQVIECKAMILP